MKAKEALESAKASLLLHVLQLSAYMSNLLDHALSKCRVKIVHRLKADTFTTSRRMDIRSIFNIYPYVIHTRSRTPKEQISWLKIVERNPFANHRLSGRRAWKLNTKRSSKTILGKSRTIESSRSGSSPGIG